MRIEMRGRGVIYYFSLNIRRDSVGAEYEPAAGSDPDPVPPDAPVDGDPPDGLPGAVGVY
ncbi:hypothetical protein KL86CLO1_12690 [uncultured Eubacteriales bacterium]|uniref:Uncharacterized protein n=1 Tax=uncultured Eubacteriales bacterium TaxID=172733 RepID=A0A212KCT7_9FIRM|nr:hypothetical protein KL86CLO1_12690 [uncultured Eubacteriales bacterium]